MESNLQWMPVASNLIKRVHGHPASLRTARGTRIAKCWAVDTERPCVQVAIGHRASPVDHTGVAVDKIWDYIIELINTTHRLFSNKPIPNFVAASATVPSRKRRRLRR